MPIVKTIILQLKRVYFELLMIIVLGVILFLLSSDTRAAMDMFLFKALLVSAGVVHAHIIRNLIFPYIDFNESKDPYHKAMIIMIYAVVIFAWSRGG
jgi:hypothetical protein